jgi:hypothetical protein
VQVHWEVLVTARRARVRPSYEEWYPRITPGVWHDAAWVTEMVLQQQRKSGPTWALGRRPLADMHFEFEGYEPRRRPSSPGERRRG